MWPQGGAPESPGAARGRRTGVWPPRGPDRQEGPPATHCHLQVLHPQTSPSFFPGTPTAGGGARPAMVSPERNMEFLGVDLITYVKKGTKLYWGP